MSSPLSGLPDPNCGGVDHRLHRRKFLQGAAVAGAMSLLSYGGLFSLPAFAEEAKRKQKRCILLWLCGAPSQFETWDPKPGRPTAGPFRSIPTSLPGIHFGELMPRCASIAHKLAIVRSMKTNQSEHLQGIELLNRGAGPRPPFIRPTLGSVLAQQLGHLDSPIPNFVLLDPCPEGNEYKEFKAGNWAGWLGAEYGPVRVGGDYRIENVSRTADLAAEDHESRNALRRFLTKKFENDRRSAAASSQNAVFDRVKGLMSCAHLFDLDKLPATDRERYGPAAFGLHALLARHLAENGAPFVMVSNGMPWDSHVFHNEIYQLLVPELDRVLFHLIEDLERRGMLDDTLVIAMGEFGRTPWINQARGRDHYPNAWSLMMAGAGIKRGVVVGSTDEDGVDVASQPFNEKNLFATIFTALGIDPYAAYDIPDLPTFHRVEEKAAPIREILATS
ncbi:MAG: DUF1501 domain-containing protein [Verrucomicrobia bacterium]|nr:DUF1501 domain-containing protein [Verrucomicrobiota bacterium]MBI3869397.1 DUF1501 domain-containing protein [Verrucomicrobiota bacterium]